MNEGNVGEPCLVSIEGVLLVLSVHSDKTLVVLSVLATLCSCVSTEVEHVPNVSSPEVLTCEELLDKLLVVVCLVFLSVVTLSGIGGMPVKSLATVLGNTDRKLRMHLVELVEPRTVHVCCSTVPTEVVVVGNNVRNLKIRRLHGTHGNRCDSGKSCLIHFVNEVVEDSVVLKEIRILIALHCNLVRETPNYDRGVVVVLSNKLLHLRNGVLTTCGHVLRNIRNFSPDYKTCSVAEVIEVLAVLIVSKSDCGRAHFHNELDILSVVLGKKSVTNAESILVTGYTAKGILSAVKDETAVRIDCEGTATESCSNLIYRLAVSHKSYACGIEVRILSTVPKVNVLDLELLNLLTGGNFNCSKSLAFLGVESVNECCAFFNVLGEYLNLNESIVATNDRSYLDTGSSVVIEIEVLLANNDELNVSVKTTVECEVCHLGINSGVSCVINCDGKNVFIVNMTGEVYSPCGVTAVVMTEVLTVKINVCGRVSAVNLEVVFCTCGELALEEALGVVASASVVIVAAVLSVSSIPTVGKVYLLANGKLCKVCRNVLCEDPIWIHAANCSHLCNSFYEINKFSFSLFDCIAIHFNYNLFFYRCQPIFIFIL